MSDILRKGGNKGNPVVISAVPDSTFKSEIDALITAGTNVVGKLVSLTFANDYEVTSPADDAIPDGEIISCKKATLAAGNSYILTVALFHYTDQNGSSHTPVCIRELDYNGTIALQDSVIVNGTTYRNLDDGGTGGWGAVIAKDTSNSKVHVLF